jgi:outer membrane protein assembly factor BamB
MSPLIEGGALVVQVGSDVHGGRGLALDPETGSEKWAWKGPGPGYGSPAVFSVDGVRQVATFTDSSIVGIDARSGNQLWSVPFTDDWHENIVPPVWTGNIAESETWPMPAVLADGLIVRDATGIARLKWM